MIRTPITEEDMKVLQEERFTHPHPRVQRKMEAVYLTGMGLPRHEVARLLAISEGTVRSYLANYREGGLEALRRFNPHPQSAALNAHTTTLCDSLIADPPHTVQEAVDRIETLTGVRRSPSTVRAWLKKTGLPIARPVPSQLKPTPSPKRYSWRLS